MIIKEKKQKIGKAINNNCSKTKILSKPKNCLLKVSYYGTPGNFLKIIQNYKASGKGFSNRWC